MAQVTDYCLSVRWNSRTEFGRLPALTNAIKTLIKFSKGQFCGKWYTLVLLWHCCEDTNRRICYVLWSRGQTRIFGMRKWHGGHFGSLLYSFKCRFGCCTHPGELYQKVHLVLESGLCYVKEHCIQSIRQGLVAGRSTVKKRDCM